MKHDRVEEAYAQALGEDAARRQVKLAADYFVCCGENRLDGHHELCSNRPKEEPVEVHPDQAALL